MCKFDPVFYSGGYQLESMGLIKVISLVNWILHEVWKNTYINIMIL